MSVTPAALVRQMRRTSLRPLVGVILLVVLWQGASALLAGRHEVPGIAPVFSTMWHDNFYVNDLGTTLYEALRGYLVGNGLAVVLGALCLMVPPVERFLLRFAVASYCIPTIALGPLLVILFSLDATKVIMAALSVFFVSLVGILVGLRDAAPSSLDLVHACGAGKFTALVKVRLRSAVPSAISGLAVAAPAAVLGAIIGEFLGGNSGLGVVMVNSESSLAVSRTWAVALVATAVSGVLFGATLLVGRLLAPGFVGSDLGRRAPEPPRRRRVSASPGRRVVAEVSRRLFALVLSIAGILGVWWALVAGFRLNPYFAKTPLAVYQSLVSPLTGPAERSQLLSGLGITLRDAGVGYLIGTVAAVALASAFVVWPVVRSTFLPLVIVLRAVPLVAMTPLLALVFGDGIGVVAAVASIVAFVPSVVIVYEGLRSPAPASLDLLHAYGAGPGATLWRLRLPYGLPALFAAAKIAVPGAVLGAVLAEWLVATNGLGREMALSITLSNFNVLWAATAAVTVISVLLYNVLNAAEQAALVRVSS